MTPFAGTNRVTSPWRQPVRPNHMGIDIVTDGPINTEPWMVRETTGGGIVIEASYGYNFGRGNLVRVQYPQHNNCVACYQHLERIDVKVGDKVEQGHRLGLAGNTGDSTGHHLHFEVRTAPGEGGQDIDPSEWCGVPNVVGNHPGNDNLDNPAPAPTPEPAPTDPFAGVSDEALAARVWAGEFGNGDARKAALGNRWAAVQALVDQGVGKPAPAPKPVNLYAAGRQIADLNGAPLFATAYTDQPANHLPDNNIGVVNPFYIHDGEEVNGRYRITNLPERVNTGAVTGWINKGDIS